MSVTASGNQEEYLCVSEEEDPETASKWGEKKYTFSDTIYSVQEGSSIIWLRE